MAKKRKAGSEKTEVPMSAMIDVVFLLLVFFLATNKPKIPEAHVAINMPSPQAQPTDAPPPPPMLEVHIRPGNKIMLMGTRQVGLEQLEEHLLDIAAFNTDQTVIIKVHPNAMERQLIEVLDTCNRAGLNELNVMMLNE